MLNLFQLSDDLTTLVCDLSYKIFKIQKGGSYDLKYKDEQKQDPLTSADLFANDFLKKNLTKLIPKSSIISEESKDDLSRLNKEFVWIVDPIDGTSDFINQKSSYSISLGLVFRNIPILGIVSMPAENYLVLGLNYQTKDYKPFILIYNFNTNQKEILYKFEYEKKSLDNAKILVSESEFKKNRFYQFPKHWHLQPTGSVARKLAMIAIKKGDLLISLAPKNEWDICGGIALIYASQQIAYTLDIDDKGLFLSPQFNKKILTSIGLVAGNPYLVHEYLEFHRNHQVQTYKDY